MNEVKQVIAFIYDFDKTLSPLDMQEFSFIRSVNMEIPEFWQESNNRAQENQMDKILSYMLLMIEKSRAAHRPIRKENFTELGKEVRLFTGVAGWFSRINKYCKSQGFIAEHYIISSGLKEIIEGTSISKFFKEIYASSFYYDENGVAIWPAISVNFTGKTQYIFRINKGVLDRTEDEELNHFTPQHERKVPFDRMVYIGDGLTDVPSFRTVRLNGGYSIAVHATGKKDIVQELLTYGRVDFIAPADYTKDSILDIIVKRIVDCIHSKVQLNEIYYSQRNEVLSETAAIAIE